MFSKPYGQLLFQFCHFVNLSAHYPVCRQKVAFGKIEVWIVGSVKSEKTSDWRRAAALVETPNRYHFLVFNLNPHSWIVSWLLGLEMKIWAENFPDQNYYKPTIRPAAIRFSLVPLFSYVYIFLTLELKVLTHAYSTWQSETMVQLTGIQRSLCQVP